MNRRNFIKLSSVTAVVGAVFGVSSFNIPTNDAPKKLSALDKINYNQTIEMIRQDVEKIVYQYYGELNDIQTRARVNCHLESMLHIKYMSCGAIYSFIIQNDETTNSPAVIDRNSMLGYVYVKLNNSITQHIIKFEIV